MIVTKYSASGNDFVVITAFKRQDYSSLAIELCDRHEGIGADGLIVVIPCEKYDFEWLFYNDDGSTALMCGNGSRAVAHYAYNNQICDKNLVFLSGAGAIKCEVRGDIVKSSLTKPKEIKKPFDELGFTWWLVDTGVPHLVSIVDDIDKFDLQIAKTLRDKYNANVNFAMIKDDKMYVRTYERGVEGETLACGTGMVACFLYAFRQKLVSPLLKAYPKSNEELILEIDNEVLSLKGNVKKIFTTDYKGQ